ncbi:ketopantoate reductase family protein [Oscillospiraceae bacterium HV4-5-C5C]|nr:ketopantoate reductase family protein [Oscillospiraceae bacterium HV4-5-C5C]
MSIQSVDIVGLGALGVLYAGLLAPQLAPGQLQILADEARCLRYRKDGVYQNGQRLDLTYVSPGQAHKPADLLIFAVKYHQLPAAVELAAGEIGPDTTILSLLNGICSEDELAERFGREKVLDTVAQGMDAMKQGNQLRYTQRGQLCLGERRPGLSQGRLEAVTALFDRCGVPYLVDPDMQKRLWGKFMLNVGVNQTTAAYKTDYAGVLRPGRPRDTMIAAMREVMALAPHAGVSLTEAELQGWLRVLEPLDPAGQPSLRQDTEARRKTEVELFAGTVIRLGQQYAVPTPVNQWLFEEIAAQEQAYGARPAASAAAAD